MLTLGIDRLARRGSERIKNGWESKAAATLYPGRRRVADCAGRGAEPQHRQPARRLGWVAALTLAGLAGASTVWGLGSQPASDITSATNHRPRPTTSTASTPAPPATVSPTSLRVPGIGVSSRLVRLGLNDDGTVEVPSDPDAAGWFDLGTVPGQRGSSVILGHVDSTRGPAVFSRLHELAKGDRFLVRLSDGTATHFRVSRIVTYPNDEFPAQRVYAGTPRRATLTLITCGGAFDPDAGGYQANVVVYAEHTGSS